MGLILFFKKIYFFNLASRGQCLGPRWPRGSRAQMALIGTPYTGALSGTPYTGDAFLDALSKLIIFKKSVPVSRCRKGVVGGCWVGVEVRYAGP